MAYSHHPVVGDTLYGRTASEETFRSAAGDGDEGISLAETSGQTEWINRQALHSLRLEFMHPITREEMRFAAPLPEDIRRLLRN